jgi:hypothetical protein
MTAHSTTEANILLTLGFADGEEAKMADNNVERATAYSRLRLRVILGGLAISGFLLTYLSHNVGVYTEPWLESVAREFGSALIVAAVIGGTVDLFFKDQFARDAFVASFRYVLPDELKEEVLRIISYKFMCTESRMIVKLEPIIDTELVRVHICMERTIKNISRDAETTDFGFALDEWGFPSQQSEIKECTYDIGDGPTVCPIENHDDPVIERKATAFEIKSGHAFKLVMKGSEVHRDNDALRGFHRHPAVNPIVEVQIPSNFRHGFSFGVPGEKVEPSRIANIYRLEGTQFPGQCSYLRWWHEKYQPAA